ncbi:MULTISPECIES: hypothetical protein [unclassified Bradyrhizobium]
MDMLSERANTAILESRLLRLELQRVRREYEQMRQRLRERTLDLARANTRARNILARNPGAGVAARRV